MTDLRPIPSLPGYLAGDDGRIYSTRSRWSVTKPRPLTETLTHDGYARVKVVRRSDLPVRWQAVAPVVAEAFLGPRPEGQEVRHLNGCRTDNRPANLAYGSARENAADRKRHGRTVHGERQHKAHHSDAEVRAAVLRVMAGESGAAVAAEIGADQSTVNGWVRGHTRAAATHDIKTWRATA